MQRGVWVLIGLALIVTTIAVILLLGRGNTENKPTDQTLHIWSPFDEAKTYSLISREYLQNNPNIKLNFRYIEAKDAKEYEAKVVNEIADGNGPDIWLVRNDWLPKHVAKSTAAIAAPETDPIAIAKGKLLHSIVDMNTHDGKLYGVPLAADSLAIIYNDDFYGDLASVASEQDSATLLGLPTTWEELSRQVSLASRANNGAVERSGLAIGTVENTFAPIDVLSAFLVQGGVTVLTEDKTNIAFNLAKVQDGQTVFPATDALSYYTSFARGDQGNYSWNRNHGDPVEAFVKGKTGALIGYYSTLQEIVKQNPKFRINVVTLPQKQKDKPRVDYAVSWSHIVNSKSSKTGLAWNYLGYLMNDEIQQEYAVETNKLPVTQHGLRTLEGTEDRDGTDAKELFERQLMTAKSLSKPEWQQVDEILQDAVRQVVNLAQAPQTSVDSAAERMKELFLGSEQQ